MLDPRNEHNTQGGDNYDGYTATNFGPKARKTAQNYENYRNFNGGGVQFRPNEPEDESGVCSPPLWRTSPPQSPVQARVANNNYRHLSPTSRAQAIARGQWELMEMVKNMPESSYELSLKDLVEHNRVQDDYSKKESLVDGKILGGEKGYQRVKSKGKEKKGKVINRSGSMDHNKGLFLHMAFPFSMGSKKKKNLVKTNAFAKVSPKPEGENKFSKGGEKDWWKKRFSTSESGVTSSNSGSTGSRGSSSSSSSSNRSNNRRKKGGCLSGFSHLLFSKKNRSAK